ncbi:MAG: M48 family metalloprotease [Coxiellaceae bacterium]|nr:M48 family metalloprotease [Coxiellaceae bacterium]
MSTLKAIIFLFVTTIFLILLGDLVAGHEGVYVAVIVAILTNYVAIFVSGRAALNLFHATEIRADTHPDVHAIMQALTVKAELPLPKLYLVDTEASTLFVIGKNPNNASIAVTKGLLNSLSTEEQTAAIAQAIAQIKLRNTFLNGVIATVAGGISGIANTGWSEVILDDKDPAEKDHFNQNVMRIVGPIAAFMIKTMISPRMQTDADSLSSEWTGHPEHLISALQTIESLKPKAPFPIADARPATAHLFIINPLHQKKWAHLFKTHPPTEVRIARLQKPQN